MSVVGLIWSLALFWGLVYAIRAICHGKNASVLPTAHTRNLHSRSAHTKITVHNLHLKLHTTALNARHDALVAFLGRARNKRVRAAVRVFYNVGTLAGVVGMLLAPALLLWTSSQIAGRAAQWTARAETGTLRLAKRGVGDIVDDSQTASTFGFHAIIPGVTVPLSHLPVLLLALLLAQVVHEAGHAISAASDALPLHALGLSLTVVLPAAFTSLSPSLTLLPLRARLRVIAAGAWHNLVFWATMSLLGWAGVSRVWGALGWRDVSPDGVVILSVEPDSPLAFSLLTGALIKSLDDTPLGATQGGRFAEDMWASYLLAKSHPPSKGWCVSATAFATAPTECCVEPAATARPPAAQLSCFSDLTAALPPPARARCVDPVPLLAPERVGLAAGRCHAAAECGGGEEWACVVPEAGTVLLRISFVLPHWLTQNGEDPQKTILWSGPRREVWEQVEVGKYQPRSRFLPLWLPGRVGLFSEYLTTMSLTLYLLNLLVLPFLDGGQLLSTLLDMLGEGDEDNVELDIEAQSGARVGGHRGSRATWMVQRRKAVIVRACTGATVGLLCFVGAGSWLT